MCQTDHSGAMSTPYNLRRLWVNFKGRTSAVGFLPSEIPIVAFHHSLKPRRCKCTSKMLYTPFIARIPIYLHSYVQFYALRMFLCNKKSLKENVALDRSSWYSKSVFNRLL